MAANIYDIGDVVRCDGTFTASGTAVDPGSVTGKWKLYPDGTITTYVYGVDAELVKGTTGIYHFDVDCDLEGTHWYRIYSEVTSKAAAEGVFLVRGSEFD